MTDARSTLERRGISTARPRLARLVAALAVTSLASTLLVVVPTLPSAAAPGEGLRLVGIIPDDEPNVGTDAEGAYLIDPVSRVVFQYYKGTSPQNTTRLMFRAMDIDEFSNGKAQRKGFDLTIDQQQVPTLAQAAGTDITRTKIDIAGREPVVTLDTKTGRLFYAAGGAMYEVDYDFAAQTQTLAKWVAPPHLGQTVPEDQLYTPSGATSPTGDETYQPSFGLAYDDSTSSPMLYQVGQIKLKDAPDASLRSLWIAGWDASPGNPAASPQLRERWFYVTQTCRNLGRDQNTEVQTPVFRDGEWLYTFCSGSTDGSARGVLRVRIDPITGPIAGTEQFFPGVTGGDTNAWADPGKARVYILTLNSKAHARSVLVFDGRASNGQGAYIGAFSVANSDDGRRDPGPAMGAVNPLTHRWYFQSDTGAWLQEGGLRRVAQPERKVSAIATSVPEIDGRQECGKRIPAHPDPCGMRFVVRRPIRVDPGTSGRRTRIFVEQERAFCSLFVANLDNCIAVYEDGFSSVGAQSTVAENTLNVPETAGLVGSYSGIGTAFGVRTRILRGFSTVWPGGVGNQTIEGDPTGNPNSVTWYATDPFFYHGGDCGANDRELVVGRIFQTALTGGLQRNMARAGALGVDPDIHVPSAADDTQTRDDLANPDPCTRHLAERLMGPNCYVKAEDFSDANQNNVYDEGEPFTDANGNGKWDDLQHVGEPYTDTDHDGVHDDDEPFTDWNGNGVYDAEACQTDQVYYPVVTPFCEGFQESDPSHYQQFVDTFGNQCGNPLSTDGVSAAWPYQRANCSDNEEPPPVVTQQTVLPSAVSVTCRAGQAHPTVSAHTVAQAVPNQTAQFVSVQQVQTSTNLVRVPATETAPGQGLTVASKAVLRGITIGGIVHIDEFVVTGSAHAEGYATPDGTTASAVGTREFHGVSIGDVVVCAGECDTAKVLEQINAAISSYGYVRASDPEQDETEGTSKGTLAKLQKDLLQQDADRTMNHDPSTEWVGLEVTVFRDSQRRGIGRWIVELGGVFAQSQFTVIRGLGRNFTPRPAVAPRTQPVGVKGATMSTPFGVVPARPTAYVAVPAPEPAASIDDASGGGLLDQIAEGFKKSVKMALVLAGLWALVYGPVYLSRRRNLLREIAAR